MTQQETQILTMVGELKGELGEVRGQLRELIHNLNNLRQTIELQAPAMHQIPSMIADLAALDVRVTALETKEHKRDGAITLGAIIAKSPMVAWLLAAVLGAIAFWRK